ncbi:Dihydroorotase [Dactylellina cionopaga]|nr:Dihydroorotase [Dactylellina cionopaga]
MSRPASMHLLRSLRPAARHLTTASTTSQAAAATAAGSRRIRNLLVANRGEIALRVHRTASKLGTTTTTLYTDPDAHAEHALVSPHSVNIGPPSAYLDIEKIVRVAKERGCDAIHPGYGFLSENAHFARRCTEEGIVFVGPPPSAIDSMGNKSLSKDIMIAAGVPCIPGYHGTNQEPAYLLSEAQNIGFPVLIKAVKGGGGKGMRIARSKEEFPDMLESAKTEARNSFGDDVVLVEKYITTPRHIEVQVFADSHGNCVALGERDCSIQRRHQKVLEESPAPHLDDVIRKDLWKKARDAALAVGYRGAGTVEFIFDNDTGEFFFMEMNTRLQVEHPVTEMVTETDLVHWQLIVAEGGKLPLTQEQVEEQMNGHAIEARIYAENPDMNFIPDSGPLIHLRTPTPTSTVRIDAGFKQGSIISSHYDPMIAKLIVKATTRELALQKLVAALEEYEVVGMSTNIEFLKRCAAHPAFIAGEVETGFIEKHREELFQKRPTPSEVYAQAALGLVLNESLSQSSTDPFAFFAAGQGGIQSRKVSLTEKHKDEEQHVNVEISRMGNMMYDITVTTPEKTETYASVTAEYSPSISPKQITAYYPHTRLETTFVRNEDQNKISVFQRGVQYNLQLQQPKWMEKALGVKSMENSVCAPMPCKVLKVMVKEGQEVGIDDALVVIESMKMETTIRSPKVGRVKRVVHGEGDICKAGTELVEFEGEGDEK